MLNNCPTKKQMQHAQQAAKANILIVTAEPKFITKIQTVATIKPLQTRTHPTGQKT